MATPAAASVIVQNFMTASFEAVDACFNKAAGNDPDVGDNTDTSLVQYADEATTPQSTYTVVENGVTLIGESITLKGLKNDRVIFTDVVRYENNCDEPIQVQLTNFEAGGDWDFRAAEVWISNSTTTDPADVDPNIDIPADDWNDTFANIPANSTGLLATSTGTVTVQPGDQIQGAFIVATGDGAGTAAADAGTLTWVAQATIVTS